MLSVSGAMALEPLLVENLRLNDVTRTTSHALIKRALFASLLGAPAARIAAEGACPHCLVQFVKMACALLRSSPLMYYLEFHCKSAP